MIDALLFAAGHGLLAGLLWYGGRLGLTESIHSPEACRRSQRLGHWLHVNGTVRRCR
jgi:hypothetical protein